MLGDGGFYSHLLVICQLPFGSEAVSLEKESNVSGKLGGVAGVFAGAKTGFNFLLVWFILSDSWFGADIGD